MLPYDFDVLGRKLDGRDEPSSRPQNPLKFRTGKRRSGVAVLALLPILDRHDSVFPYRASAIFGAREECQKCSIFLDDENQLC